MLEPSQLVVRLGRTGTDSIIIIIIFIIIIIIIIIIIVTSRIVTSRIVVFFRIAKKVCMTL